MPDKKYVYDLRGRWQDTLVALWNRFRDPSAMTDCDFRNAWNALQRYGYWLLENSWSGIQKNDEGEPTADEIMLWDDFIKDLMQGPFRIVVPIKSGSALNRAFRKYRTERLIPCYKEVYKVLSNALNQLVREHKLHRSDVGAIRDDSAFWTSAQTPLREANCDECDRLCAKLPDLGLRLDQRDLSTLHKRMLTPKQASDFVMGLFEGLGCNCRVNMGVLKQCVFQKTRNMFSLQTFEYKDEICSTEREDDGRIEKETETERNERWEANRFNRIEGRDDRAAPSDLTEEDEGPSSTKSAAEESLPDQQQQQLASDTAVRIWNRLGNMGEDDQKILAGYVFPKSRGEKISMSEFGKATTVDYRIKKIFEAIREELSAVLTTDECLMNSYVEDPVANLTLEKLRELTLEKTENIRLNYSDKDVEEVANDTQN